MISRGPDAGQCGASFDFHITPFTAAEEEQARCAVARRALDRQDYLRMLEMLGLTVTTLSDLPSTASIPVTTD